MTWWRLLGTLVLGLAAAACDLPGPHPPAAINHVHSSPASSASPSPSSAGSVQAPAEPSPTSQVAPTSGPVRAADRCHTGGLSVSFAGSEGAAGTIIDTLRMVNSGRVACTVFGFVGLQMLDAAGQPLPTRVVRNGGILSTQAGPSRFLLQPGAAATFQAAWSDVPRVNEGPCPQAARLIVTPPDEYDHQVIPVSGWSLAPCGGGEIDVGPLRAAGSAS